MCGASFVGKRPYKGKAAPIVCGRTLCWAIAYWTAEEWAGRKRMAVALVGAAQEVGEAWLTSTWVDPVLGERWQYPSWSELDEEAMRRG